MSERTERLRQAVDQWNNHDRHRVVAGDEPFLVDGKPEEIHVAESVLLAESLLLGACRRYCGWCETGKPTMTPNSMAYSLVSDIRRALAHLRGEDCCIDVCKHNRLGPRTESDNGQ